MPYHYRTIPQLSKQDIERFWSYVDKTPGQGPNGSCWQWKGAVSDRGYGQLGIKSHPYKAHRLSYFIATGKQPSAHICHRCDNRPCVNPVCLFDGSPLDNTRDMIQKGRQCSSERMSQIIKLVCARGDRHYRPKYSDVEWLQILRERKLSSNNAAAAKYGLSTSAVSARWYRMRHLL